MAEIFKKDEKTGKWVRVTKKKMQGSIKMAGAQGARRNPVFMNS